MAKSGFALTSDISGLSKARRAIHAGIGETANDIAFAAEYYAVTEHDYRNQTGNLEGGTYGEVTSTDSRDGLAVLVGSYMFYAVFVEAWCHFLERALEKALVDVEGQLRDNVKRKLKNV